MRFYRGIAVPENEVNEIVARIRLEGLKDTYKVPDLKACPRDGKKWNKLLHSTKLGIDLTRKENAEVVYACGDRKSALYYACIHIVTEVNTHPMLIEFDAPQRDVWVDGKDFLYNVLQLWDQHQAGVDRNRKKEVVQRTLLMLYGEAIFPYLQQIFTSKKDELHRRWALTDLAVNDAKVVTAHYRNKKWICGRYGTVFRNAFCVRSPISGSRIAATTSIKQPFAAPSCDVKISDLLT